MVSHQEKRVLAPKGEDTKEDCMADQHSTTGNTESLHDQERRAWNDEHHRLEQFGLLTMFKGRIEPISTVVLLGIERALVEILFKSRTEMADLARAKGHEDAARAIEEYANWRHAKFAPWKRLSVLGMLSRLHRHEGPRWVPEPDAHTYMAKVDEALGWWLKFRRDGSDTDFDEPALQRHGRALEKRMAERKVE